MNHWALPLLDSTSLPSAFSPQLSIAWSTMPVGLVSVLRLIKIPCPLTPSPVPSLRGLNIKSVFRLQLQRFSDYCCTHGFFVHNLRSLLIIHYSHKWITMIIQAWCPILNNENDFCWYFLLSLPMAPETCTYGLRCYAHSSMSPMALF